MTSEDSWRIITEWFSEDKDLEWVKDGLVDFTIQQEELAGWEQAVRYQGFDVKILLKKLKASFTRYETQARETTSFIYKTKDGDKTFSYSNKEHIMKDIALMLYMFANRGTSWTHLKQKSRKEFQDIMLWMEEKYQIDTSKREAGQSVGPEVVIVSRIAACFPLKVCEFFDNNHGRILFPLKEIDIASPTRSIYCGSFTSMIPMNDATYSCLHYISFYTHYLNDRVLHADKGKYTKIKQMMTYYKAAHNSVAVPNGARLKYMITTNIIGKTTIVREPYRHAAEKCKLSFFWGSLQRTK